MHGEIEDADSEYEADISAPRASLRDRAESTRGQDCSNRKMTPRSRCQKEYIGMSGTGDSTLKILGDGDIIKSN